MAQKRSRFFSCHSYDNVSHCQCNICVCMLLFSKLSNWCQLYLFGNSILGYPPAWLVSSSHRQNHQIRVMYPWHHSIIYNSICSPWCFCFIQTFARMCDQLFTYLYDSIHLKSYIHVNLFQTQVKYLHHFTYPKNMEHVRFPWLLNHQLSETKTYPIYFRFVSISLRKNLPWKSHGPDDFPLMSGPESRPRCGQNSDPEQEISW